MTSRLHEYSRHRLQHLRMAVWEQYPLRLKCAIAESVSLALRNRRANVKVCRDKGIPQSCQEVILGHDTGEYLEVTLE